MTRTIVSVFANNDRVSFNLYLAPGDIPNARDLYDFECTENDPPFMQMSQGLLAPDIVKCAGTHLFENLSKHPAVKDAVTMALASTPDKVAPLYVYLNADVRMPERVEDGYRKAERPARGCAVPELEV
jgi:hypothetical protein